MAITGADLLRRMLAELSPHFLSTATESYGSDRGDVLENGHTFRPPVKGRQVRNGRYRGECLAAKTERGDAFEVVQRSNFRRCVPGERQRQLVACDSAAVVTDPDQLDAAFLELDADRRTARIERVLEQFLEH